MSKIVIEVESDFHKMLKMKALEMDMTMKDLIVNAIKKFLDERSEKDKKEASN